MRLGNVPHPLGDIRRPPVMMCCKNNSSYWRNDCTRTCMEPVTFSQRVQHAMCARAHEIIDKTLLEIWRRPSLPYARRMAEWELRTWLLGILSRAGYSETSLGFLQFSRPFPWHETVETVRILTRITSQAVGETPEAVADLRHFFNQYLIRMGEHYDGRSVTSQPGAAPYCQAHSDERPQRHGARQDRMRGRGINPNRDAPG